MLILCGVVWGFLFLFFVLQVMFILCDAVFFVVLQINMGVYSNYTIILYSV